jgi:hypothetical protein
MSLEEETVFQVMNQKHDRKYLSDVIDGLRDLGLRMDDKKVESSLQRYEILQEYNSQNSDRKALRKKIKAKIDEKTKQEIEKLRLNSFVQSVTRIYTTRLGSMCNGAHCPSCSSRTRTMMAKIRVIRKSDGEVYFSFKAIRGLFNFCKTCGTITKYVYN